MNLTELLERLTVRDWIALALGAGFAIGGGAAGKAFGIAIGTRTVLNIVQWPALPPLPPLEQQKQQQNGGRTLPPRYEGPQPGTNTGGVN